MSKLVIVESPAKAKTIEKYLGSGYRVRASVGHIRDLPKSNKDAIDIEGGFIPRYEVTKGKEKVIAELRSESKKADDVLLATDPDREGEAIAWHIAQVLGLEKSKVQRVVFNEITESAVKEALLHPRDIDEDLLKAQEARRVLDRLMGYDLSGLIWKKVRYGLSAGRVQSPALRILMEKEREIRAFIAESYWIITAHLGVGLPSEKTSQNLEFTCIEEPRDKQIVDKIVEEGRKGDWFVKDIEEKEQARKSRPPLTTSTLQQTASSRLGFSPANTMRIAQKLYEAGLITYMRTDSTNLSKEALSTIAKVVINKFGRENQETKVYKTKSKNAQEAHEAIRPTNVSREIAGFAIEQKRLYRLIWQRTIASQMIDATVLRTKILSAVKPLSVGGLTADIPDFVVNGSHVVKPGWLLADPESRGEDVDLPKLKKGTKLELVQINSEGKETQPPNRYTEAGLVKELEKRGIGRPSTYASIIKNIQDRGYVTKEGKTLMPTDTGDVVSTFLEEHFAKVISDTFTAEMENELDDIANGKREYVKTLSDFYTPFSKDLKAKDKEIGKITTLGDASDNFKCPQCEGRMVIKLGKSGKFLSCKSYPDCTGSRTMDGEEMKAPEEIGKDCPKCGDTDKGRLVERFSKYGKFISCNRYPKCKYVEVDEETKKASSTGVACPTCKSGDMTQKRGRFGEFFACSNYPDCKHTIKARPTGGKCSICEALMMEGTKTIPERCSIKSCPMHNPHKLNPNS